jgi:hypothetical protein
MARSTIRFCLAMLLAVATISTVQADEFDVIKSYRFIPAWSRAKQTGGFAGYELDFTVRGTFDLNFGPEVSIPELEIHPSFENVQSWMIPHNLLTYVEITDRVFNLSGLEGNYTRHNRIVFDGKNDQGATVKVKATFAGPLVQLRGTTQPPCCDFFQYSLDAYALTAPYADFNFDGRVDSSDYTTWRDHLGLATGATLDQGDADGDGDVDLADYSVWKKDAGTTIDMAAFADADVDIAAQFNAVPEPATATLLTACAIGLATISAHRRRAGR